MRITLSAVFFLATVPLGLMATELQPAGHRTPNVQDTNVQDARVGEAQHRRLKFPQDGGTGGGGGNTDDDGSSIEALPTFDETGRTSAPTMTHTEPCLTREPSTALPISSLTPSPSTIIAVPSPTPTPSTTNPVPSMTPAPPTSAPTAAPSTSPVPLTRAPVQQLTLAPSTAPTDMEILLDLHNEARCLHNADPLTYSDAVAISAMAHAEVLSNSCGQLFHSESEDRNGYGENLYLCGTSGTISCYTPEAAMTALYENEIQVDYVAEYGGHATQILWKSTTELGCAVVPCTLDPWNYVYLVCQYNPLGNFLGRLEDEVELPSGNLC